MKVYTDTGGRTAKQTAARETNRRLDGSLDHDGSIRDDQRFHVIEKVGGRLVADSIAMDITGGQSSAQGERADRVLETSDTRGEGGASASGSALSQDAIPEGERECFAAGRVLDDETRTVVVEAGGSQQKGGDRLTAGGTRPINDEELERLLKDFESIDMANDNETVEGRCARRIRR